jgi:hypothetical protein
MIYEKEKEDSVHWIREFIQESIEEENAYREKYFSNGVLRYQYRTEADKVENCGRLISMYIGADGMQRERREFRCKLPTCEKCMAIRANEREKDFTNRLDAAAGETLFRVVISGDLEQKRLREWAYKNGYEYLSVPTESGDKEVFINGPRRGSSPIHVDDAKAIVKKLGRVMHLDRSKKVSGKLGKEEKVKSEEKKGASVTLLVREYAFSGKRPSKVEMQIADAKAMSLATELTEGFDGVFTEQNVQAVFSQREDSLQRVYQKMGFSIHFFAPVEKVYDLDAMTKSWARVEAGRHKFHGSMSSLSPLVRLIVTRAMEERSKKEADDSFAEDIEVAAQSLISTE